LKSQIVISSWVSWQTGLFSRS